MHIIIPLTNYWVDFGLIFALFTKEPPQCQIDRDYLLGFEALLDSFPMSPIMLRIYTGRRRIDEIYLQPPRMIPAKIVHYLEKPQGIKLLYSS